MSDATVKGTIHLIEETKTYGQKGFRKRLVVLEQSKGGGFTNYVPVEFLKDACDSVDELHLGDEIEVAYRLSGRRWQRDESSEPKYFLSAEAMSFRVLNGGGSGQSAAGPDVDSVLAEAADDDVPF
ncbi:MAG: DUF3127 domain-containing protein [Pirellulales bacterium]|jgi:hypothetical protein|nr:DUF3127 domain-containing protein [Pirellulales bacterium]MDO7689555.1 DUF3127 domain-containing protein [Pirellulales bacterium]MDO7713316.1 DUF3127 domain-containing protein [Pirellulales bacterium]